MKVCSKCEEIKNLDCFHKNKNGKDGLDRYCKECRNNATKEWRDNNREHYRTKTRSYYAADPQKFRDRRKNYIRDNYDHCRNQWLAAYIRNRESILERVKKYTPDKIRKKISNSKYYYNNKDKVSKVKKKWAENNLSKINHYSAKRRALRIRATPVWLTEEHEEIIQDLYIAAQAFRLYTGLMYHVDHIIPLNNKRVCGLHVPWNLQILEEKDNLAKHNKFEEE